MLEPIPLPANVLGSWREALRLVRARSTELGNALSQVEQAQAQAETALSRAYPIVSATSSLQQHLLLGKGTNFTADGPQNNVDIPNPSTLWSAKLSVRQPLVNLQTWQDVRAARATQHAAQIRTLDVERQVLARVADTIVLVVTAERLAEVSRVALRASLSSLDLTRRRAQLGASSALDVLRAEQEVALNRTQVVASNESLLKARESLGMALGYSGAWGVRPEIRLDDLGKDARSVCSPVNSLAERADLQAAQADLDAAKTTSEAARYRLAPTLDLVSDVTVQTGPVTPNGRPMQWTVGALLSVPIYDGGSRNAERHLNSARIDSAKQTLTQASRNAELQVVQATRAVDVATQNFELSRTTRDLAKETSRLAKLSFINGKATSFELVDATRREQQAELDLAVKEFDVVRARISALLAQSNCDL
jgi:outer membrane protein TolC